MSSPNMHGLNKAITVLNGFLGKVNKSKCKPNQLWLDQGRELYKNLM